MWISLVWCTYMLTASPPIVALDAGHGGLMDGALGVCGLKEKDLTFALVHRLHQLLLASGLAEPVQTRLGDETLSLTQRAARANAAGARLFVSIHANASPNPVARGIETYFLSQGAASGRLHHLVLRENDGLMPQVDAKSDTSLQRLLRGLSLDASHHESQVLALQVQEVLATRLHARGRGVLQAPFMVLLAAQMAAVLVEVGFLTNPQECQLLGNAAHQENIAQALSSAILAHLAFDEAAPNAALGVNPP